MEWQTLINFLGGIEEAGKKMKSLNGWKENRNGTNESAFNGLPSGYRKLQLVILQKEKSELSFNKSGALSPFKAEFIDIEAKCGWWSATQSPEKIGKAYAFRHFLVFGNDGIKGGIEQKKFGYSVRCIEGDNLNFFKAFYNKLFHR